MFTEIVRRAMAETVVDIGQLSKTERKELGAAIKAGILVKGKGGPYPVVKTVYASIGFDFLADREMHVNLACALAELDAKLGNSIRTH
jgi:hypothetical protein